MVVLDYIISAYIIIFWTIIIVWNVGRFIFWIICFRKKRCREPKCPYSVCCCKHISVLNRKDMESLYQWIKRWSDEDIG